MWWEVGSFYKSTRSLSVEQSLDGEFAPSIFVPKGSYFVCMSAKQRSFVSEDYGGDDSFSSLYVVLHCFDPRAQDRTVRISFWPTTSASQYDCLQKIKEPLVVLALAATGLGDTDES